MGKPDLVPLPRLLLSGNWHWSQGPECHMHGPLTTLAWGGMAQHTVTRKHLLKTNSYQNVLPRLLTTLTGDPSLGGRGSRASYTGFLLEGLSTVLSHGFLGF